METVGYSLELDELTNKQLSVYLYQNVNNIEEIHKKLVNKELPCCIVKANLVIDPFQIAIAANRAALNEKYGQMVTRSLFTEIIYCLSTSKNISQSLKNFGISSVTKNVLVVLVHSNQEKEPMEKLIFESIEGERLLIKRLSEFADINLIKNIYKIEAEELKVSSLLDSIISRINDKVSK
ncbi:EKC/KEOPS complex subunit Tprkb-like [Phymastichus coffea]|uniref:EKC/KEOPS complex subunit Tprkb-like n=1 Tax=Phymastichus coffea TaxID=108790 RepID=UPI00273A8DBF|nr:EKC/KEOPS complex subunit Tprkb-like [Phymastichus coffea]